MRVHKSIVAETLDQSNDGNYRLARRSKMLQGGKVINVIKGALTWLPLVNYWRSKRVFVGGTDSSRYSYSVWLRHLVKLSLHGFNIRGAHIGELGPGDSLGTGLAALLSGAARYFGLDIVPFAAKTDLNQVFDELFQMYLRMEPIPDNAQFPHVRPRLDRYDFPKDVVDWSNLKNQAEKISCELRAGVNQGHFVNYQVPWMSSDGAAVTSLDLIFSQAVLEHVDSLQETYEAMFRWLKNGGYGSHVIDFSAHHLSPIANAHWTYCDWEWRLARGRREFFLNREPLSTHVACARKVGFEVLVVEREYAADGFGPSDLSGRFRELDPEDVRTRSAMLILRKPPSATSPLPR